MGERRACVFVHPHDNVSHEARACAYAHRNIIIYLRECSCGDCYGVAPKEIPTQKGCLWFNVGARTHTAKELP